MAKKRKSSWDLTESADLIGGRYQILDKIGSGSFGDVFSAVDIGSGEVFAVKIESHKYGMVKQLEIEQVVYKQLQGLKGVPQMRWFGQIKQCAKTADVLVLDQLGPSLEDVLLEKRTLSLPLTLNFAEQALDILEAIHSRNYIHRDIKPDNFLWGAIGTPTQSKIFIVDFGLAVRYQNNMRKHIPFRSDRRLTGTARYASINSHRGLELSRRDDLESLSYVMVYFLKGRLPWQGMVGNTRQARYEHIAHIKQSTSLESLCEGLPTEFISFIYYCRTLGFEQSPSYTYLRGLLKIMADRVVGSKIPSDPEPVFQC